MAAPPFSNVTFPQRAVLLVPAVTVAINVTLWLVPGEAGVTSRLLVVGCDATGIGDAITTAVFLVLAGVLPPGPVAVTTHTTVLPMSAADSA